MAAQFSEGETEPTQGGACGSLRSWFAFVVASLL